MASLIFAKVCKTIVITMLYHGIKNLFMRLSHSLLDTLCLFFWPSQLTLPLQFMGRYPSPGLTGPPSRQVFFGALDGSFIFFTHLDFFPLFSPFIILKGGLLKSTLQSAFLTQRSTYISHVTNLNTNFFKPLCVFLFFLQHLVRSFWFLI